MVLNVPTPMLSLARFQRRHGVPQVKALKQKMGEEEEEDSKPALNP